MNSHVLSVELDLYCGRLGVDEAQVFEGRVVGVEEECLYKGGGEEVSSISVAGTTYGE
jgi:hypothetical protein